MIGITNSVQKQRINVAKSCNDLFWAFLAAMCVLRFKRRPMYMFCTISLLIIYIAWTISMVRGNTLTCNQRLTQSDRNGTCQPQLISQRIPQQQRQRFSGSLPILPDITLATMHSVTHTWSNYSHTLSEVAGLQSSNFSDVELVL